MAADIDQALSNAIASGFSAPVDILTWLLRKGGLPIEKPVMGSEWMKEKGLTKEVKPGAAQVVGETVGNLVDPLGSIAPAAKALQAGLYANALRKDLLASTAVNSNALIKSGALTRELTNPSLAVTKNKISDFDARDLVLIAKEGVFDPRTSNTTLHAFDAFTPRRNQVIANPQDFDKELESLTAQYSKHPELLAKALQEAKRDYANKRLVDRFFPTFVRGGQMTEGSRKPMVEALPKYGDGDLRIPRIDIQPGTGSPLQKFSYGPRFQSFRHYETSPYGAARLDSGPSDSDIYHEFRNLLGADVDEAAIHAALSGEHGKLLIPGVQKLLQALRLTKSDYGELKAFGPVGLHPGNFTGAIINNPASYSARRVGELLRKRGLQVENRANTKEETFDIADWMAKGVKAKPVFISKPIEPYKTTKSSMSDDFVKENPAIAQMMPLLMKQQDAITELSPKQYSQLQAVYGKEGAQEFTKKLFDPKTNINELDDNTVSLIYDLGLDHTPLGKALTASFSFPE